ncbi:MAG: relaxase/mobilization nuclease domain-containing protein [Clostridium sp.]|nr:relaxase/mobilization nuclease domain-containing protein [Clostridium sp.]
MAATKLFPITATEVKDLRYISDPRKTENGKHIFTYMCSNDPMKASHNFELTRMNGTGLNTVLSQHLIQSFAPNEVTPEEAMQITNELCEKLLKGEYQYYLAVHTDKNHIHSHVIFNNVNMRDGRTFETHENQGSKQNRAWKKLMDLSDEICKNHGLSVIENPEMGKGKSHFEWDMNRQNLSWKAKLKFAIDQVIKESENFEDFLRKCKTNGIEVVYNPEHVIDLKFRLDGQKKFTRSRTLSWFYESKQISRRIAMYRGIYLIFIAFSTASFKCISLVLFLTKLSNGMIFLSLSGYSSAYVLI